ncbi:arrestin [Lindgomyces ingoldianus]|uniref:Arrestin n=1 Tax=Lindgomyces ingoldianus TaxID=673940 RepID=A0ACB6QXU1_9PLEO|nr:arrestin [Lindgomyces ingoldianus]KAF2471021.1 arrestin [Lindgomyces ingoldianus]
MHSSSMQSIGNQIGYKVRNIAHYGQPQIEINLDGGHGPTGRYVTSYSTMDTITGTVSVTAAHDTRFEDIEIAFTGTSQVFVDRLTTTPSISGRTEATHRFLTLKQPINEADLPQPRSLVAGKKYVFPFIFTIPSQLLPRACPHTVASDHVRETHLMLPPSLGDPDLAGHSGALLDDLAPEMSKIIYGIKARITQIREADGAVSLIAEKMKKVRVKPAFEEQPPLNVDPFDPEYRIRHEKVIRKGFFKGKLGTLTAQSAQPKPLVIPGARSVPNAQITTMATVLLRFDPADESNAPPRLGSLATKMKVSTFYASAPRQNFPARASLGIDLTQGVYQESVSLSSLCVGSAQWKKHTSASNPALDDSIERRDSGISDCSSTSANNARNAGILTQPKNYQGGSFYTAKILVPITLPNNKNFIPTFHTCLISRIYGLSLQLSIHAPGVSDPSVHLKVPIQICAEGSITGNENARARSVEASVAREADSMFTPRSVAPPNPYAHEREDLPPEYAVYAPRHTSGVTVVG